MTSKKSWGAEALWQAPRTDLNSSVGLGQEEAEILTHLLECVCLASELLEEETLVNAELSPVEPKGNPFGLSIWSFRNVSMC